MCLTDRGKGETEEGWDHVASLLGQAGHPKFMGLYDAFSLSLAQASSRGADPQCAIPISCRTKGSQWKGQWGTLS